MKKRKFDNWDEYWGTRFTEFPCEHLIRFVRRNFQAKNIKGMKALDLGTGVGTQAIFLANCGFDTYAIEGSKGALKKADHRLVNDMKPGAVLHLDEGDMVKLPYEDNFFDIVVDIASIQHNKRADIIKIINEVKRVMKPGARFFTMMRTNWDYLYGNGMFLEKGTLHNIPGDLSQAGITHFFGLAEIQILFTELGKDGRPFFSKTEINYTETTIGGTKDKVAHWLVSCTK